MEEVIKILKYKRGNIKPIYFDGEEAIISILYLIILKKCIV
jgi:hypothetical protein